MSRTADCDVLVCGLGPVGQLLSLLLGRRGVSVIGIDKADEPFDLPRAAVVDDEVLRIFQAAGVAEAILADSQVQDEVSFVTDRGWPYTLLRPIEGVQGHPPLVSIHQPSLERTLIGAAGEQASVSLRWGSELERVTQTREGVEALVRKRGGGERATLRARWLIGCDGGPSWVRRLLGVEFGGSTFRQRWLVVDAKVDRPLTKVPHPHFFGDPRRPIVSLPMSPGRHRWEWMIHPGEDEAPFLDPASIHERIDPFLDGEEVRVERAAVYTFHDRIAARWRAQRVLLAGDAAHLMPPFAGQGFSSGARDAANLAWKLEAVVDGAPQNLLDTYEAERRPHVEAMSRLAVTIGRFVQTARPAVAVLRDALLTGLESTGAAGWMREHMKPIPAYGSGAFAARPNRLPFKRGVGSQFPQPLVATDDGAERWLDEALGPGWSALAIDDRATAVIAHDGVRTFTLGRDLTDRDGAIRAWLAAEHSEWAVLRPDRFVFACGSGAEAAADAMHERRRLLGRAA